MSEGNIHFIEFNNRKIPKFLEVKNKEYISYGEKNDYPYYLANLYKRSSFHSAIINAKVNYIAGGGWTYDKRGVVSIAQKAIAEKLINQPFADTDLDETTCKVAKDIEIFNGCILLITWSKNKKSFTIQHGDFANFRTNAEKTEFYYTRAWFTYKNGATKENKKPEEEKDWQVYKAYNPDERTGTQVYYDCGYFPDQYVYPIPIYHGACTWVESHIKYGDFQYSNISKSFSPAKVINVYGVIPEDDIQRKITQDIKENFTGEEGDRLVVSFQLSDQTGIKVDNVLVEDQANLYKEIAEQSKENIFTAHEFPKLLLGITTEGALGQRNELITLEESFYNRYIVPAQRRIEKIINTLASDIGIGIKFKLKRTKSVEWMPDDTTISRVLGDVAVAEYLREKLAIQSITKQAFYTQERQASIEMFMNCGVDANGFDVIEERDIPTTDPIELEKFEKQYLGLQFADMKLNKLDRSVLDLLIKDPYIDAAGIAKATKSTPEAVKQSLDRLVDRELISPYKENIADEKVRAYEVSKEAQKSLDQTPARTSEYEVMYRYDVAAGMGAKVIAGTRDFCRQLIELNRMYTRDEINAMSEREDRNVWSLRGGWYHNPRTGINESSCRHTWRQVIVKKK